MKKKYIYLGILLVATVILTLILSTLYNREVKKFSYAYENLNKIVNTEFDEYMMEHPDTIIYIGDKSNLENNKFEKKLVKKLEELNLIENIIYIEKQEFNDSLKGKILEDYNYKYKEKELPAIIVINDGKMLEIVTVDKETNVENIIDYEVFEW